MSNSQPWHDAVGFSDRLGIIMKMHVERASKPAELDLNGHVVKSIADVLCSYRSLAYRQAHPEVGHSDAQAQAKDIESRIYNNALTLADYERLCEDASQIQVEVIENDEQKAMEHEIPLQLAAETMAIGPFKDASFYKSGLFSTIYRATVPESVVQATDIPFSFQTVALKLTKPSTMAPPHNSRREASILRSIKCQNIIPLLDTFSLPGGYMVIAQPFLSFDLEQISSKGTLSMSHKKGLLKDLLNGLAHLHSLGIIHRDVKPSNVLLSSPSGPACLADFGIAWSESDSESEPADAKMTDVGTTCYRPPELLFGWTKYGYSLDIWAAGCVIAEVMDSTLRTLFDSGELGSELALIQSIFQSLGTPDLDIWPEAASFPDWGKMEFYKFPPKPWSALLPNSSFSVRDLVSKMVRYESRERIQATYALEHPFFNP